MDRNSGGPVVSGLCQTCSLVVSGSVLNIWTSFLPSKDTPVLFDPTSAVKQNCFYSDKEKRPAAVSQFKCSGCIWVCVDTEQSQAGASSSGFLKLFEAVWSHAGNFWSEPYGQAEDKCKKEVMSWWFHVLECVRFRPLAVFQSLVESGWVCAVWGRISTWRSAWVTKLQPFLLYIYFFWGVRSFSCSEASALLLLNVSAHSLTFTLQQQNYSSVLNTHGVYLLLVFSKDGSKKQKLLRRHLARRLRYSDPVWVCLWECWLIPGAWQGDGSSMV